MTMNIVMSQGLDFSLQDDGGITAISFAQTIDAFTIQIVGYEKENFSMGLSSRLEEELPYEDHVYVYSGFYYLDLGLNFASNRFNFGFSIENLLNFNSDDFSIDPILESSKGIVDAFYFSQESDTRMSFTIAYNF